jgi:glycosyltransferase involved in cell wall biosynthesis
MRLLLATDVFPPRCGGSGWSTYALARTLRARGHAVAIVRAALDPRRAAPYDYDGFRVEQVAVAVPGVPVLRNVAKNEVFWALGGRALAAAARRHQADLIHGQHVMTIPAAVRAGRALGLPVVATVRDYWATCPISTRLRPEGICERCSVPRLAECLADHRPGRLPLVGLFEGYVRANRRRRQAALRAADRVIAVSRFVADDLATHAGVAATVIPNMVDVPETLPRPPGDWPPDRPYALFVGKLDHHKGADLLPEIVSATARDVDLVVIGDGPLRAGLERDCARLHVRVHLLPDVPNAAVLGWMAHARALLFPARWPEPLSRVLLEAASVGCPIIATPTGGTPDTLIDWVSGYLADRLGDLPLRLRQLLDDEETYQRVSRAARQVACQRFATPVVAAQMEALYAALLPTR